MKGASIELDDRKNVLSPNTPDPYSPREVEAAESPAQYLTGIRLYGLTAT